MLSSCPGAGPHQRIGTVITAASVVGAHFRRTLRSRPGHQVGPPSPRVPWRRPRYRCRCRYRAACRVSRSPAVAARLVIGQKDLVALGGPFDWAAKKSCPRAKHERLLGIERALGPEAAANTYARVDQPAQARSRHDGGVSRFTYFGLKTSVGALGRACCCNIFAAAEL